MPPSAVSQALIDLIHAKDDAADIDFLRRDDLGDHFVQWLERTEKDEGPAAIWFYVDEVNSRVVIETIGEPVSAEPEPENG